MMYNENDIKIFAEKHNISESEAKEQIEILLKERDLTNKGIDKTIKRNGYLSFSPNMNIFGYGENDNLNNKYICYTPNLNKILQMDKKDIAIVTGFGATNAPTIGTISMIIKALDFQKKSKLYTYIIINDLGSLNARRIDIEKVLDLTEHFKDFLKKMGFDESCGEIRTHNNIDHARVFSLVSSVLKIDDFGNNSESTDKTYDRLKIRGNDFSALVDHTYTATDVLLPIIKDQKKAIIVPCGLEEFYHANIGGIAISRMMQSESLRQFLPDTVEVGAIYSKIIGGLFPYFKQSKSIPNSSISLSDTKETIYNKIVNSSSLDQETILQMILQASDWNNEKLQNAIKAFKNMENDYKSWENNKIEFVEYITKIKDVWDSYKPNSKSIREKLF